MPACSGGMSWRHAGMQPQLVVALPRLAEPSAAAPRRTTSRLPLPLLAAAATRCWARCSARRTMAACCACSSSSATSASGPSSMATRSGRRRATGGAGGAGGRGGEAALGARTGMMQRRCSTAQRRNSPSRAAGRAGALCEAAPRCPPCLPCAGTCSSSSATSCSTRQADPICSFMLGVHTRGWAGMRCCTP